MSFFEQRDLQERFDKAIEAGTARVDVLENIGGGSTSLRGKLIEFSPGRVTYNEVQQARDFRFEEGELKREWKDCEGPFHAGFDSSRKLEEDKRNPGRFKFFIPHVGEGTISLNEK
jgi:hypothetical protein